MGDDPVGMGRGRPNEDDGSSSEYSGGGREALRCCVCVALNFIMAFQFNFKYNLVKERVTMR